MISAVQTLPRNKLLLLAAVLAWLLLCLPPAVAQRNSLFGARQGPEPAARQVPTTQPAHGPADPLAIGAALGIRAAMNEIRPEPKPNVTLLDFSPFAVDVPEPEQIKVHDQIMVIIRESKTATTDSKLEQKKDWTNEWELSKWIKLSDLHGLVPALLEHGNPAVEFEYKDDYAGDGKYDRKDELTTRIQATVLDVKPNGTLVLEARKGVAIDEEGYTITLTGTCRSQDVTPTNTILSTQIADLEVQVEHAGAVRDAARRGWLKRALDFLRPF